MSDRPTQVTESAIRSDRDKAYLVTYQLVNEMEAIVYADNAADALRRFNAGGRESPETNGQRLGAHKVKRCPDQDAVMGHGRG